MKRQHCQQLRGPLFVVERRYSSRKVVLRGSQDKELRIDRWMDGWMDEGWSTGKTKGNSKFYIKERKGDID